MRTISSDGPWSRLRRLAPSALRWSVKIWRSYFSARLPRRPFCHACVDLYICCVAACTCVLLSCRREHGCGEQYEGGRIHRRLIAVAQAAHHQQQQNNPIRSHTQALEEAKAAVEICQLSECEHLDAYKAQLDELTTVLRSTGQ